MLQRGETGCVTVQEVPVPRLSLQLVAMVSLLALEDATDTRRFIPYSLSPPNSLSLHFCDSQLAFRILYILRRNQIRSIPDMTQGRNRV